MSKDDFFDEVREQSEVKTEMVEKYFDAWARIITAVRDRDPLRPDKRIGYVDLFAGPGRYRDGTPSTPLRVLQKAIANPGYAQRFVTIFNDRDQANVRALQEAIQSLPGIERLRYPPELWNDEVGDGIAQRFEAIRTIPLLAFIDPWGYKGVSLRLLRALFKDWGCDCIIFFNYRRINAGLSNPFFRENMCALFGSECADRLREELDRMAPDQREATVVDAFCVALQQQGARYVLPFCFKDEFERRTSHHLILVSKNFKAYDVMKTIMAKYSSEAHQGVPTFTYMPAFDSSQQLLFELNRPLDDLRGMLLAAYAGRTVTRHEIYEEHSVGQHFIESNYTAVLKQLEEDRVIVVERPERGRRGTFGPNTKITFPSRT